MSTNVEGGQVLSVLVEGVVVELGELLCVSLSPSWPAQHLSNSRGGAVWLVLHLPAIALKSERSC